MFTSRRVTTAVVRAAGTVALLLGLVSPADAYPAPEFYSKAGITIADAAPASPYPSTIAVSGLVGTVTDVDVTFRLTHTFPDDVDVLLVAPGGRNAVVMSDAGGANGVSDVGLYLDDDSGGPLPDSAALSTTVYQPADYAPADAFPAPAPAPSGATALSTFDGIDPNGTWSLFVVDDSPTDSGSSTQWGLAITTTGSIAIPPSGPATPYPSTVMVSGLPAPVTDVNLVLSRLSHAVPEHLDFLLVGPGGQRAVVMSDAGGTSLGGPFTLTLDDEAATPLPDGDGLASGTYRPANHAGDDPFPPPAPSPVGAGSSLSVFDGTDPNGTWGLYAFDDTAGDAGDIGGWSLQINPAVKVGKAPVKEGKRAVFTVTLPGASATPLSFVVSTQGGTAKAGRDFKNVSGTLTFGAGDTAEQVAVKTRNDRRPERKERFFLNVLDQSGAILATGKGVIRDND